MGIKGVGMATLAVMAKEAGIIVSGSDTEEEFITDEVLRKAEIDVAVGFKEDNPQSFFGTTPNDECLFIATAAHDGFNNLESVYAKTRGVRVISHGEAVGMFMNGEIFGRQFEGISVSGAHGKTTISGMLAAVLTKLNMDPSYTVGTSEIFPIGAAGHFGKGKYFIAEADEYFAEMKHQRMAKFLYQKPMYLIINNIDFDHPDVYQDIEAIIATYKEFVFNARDGGLLIINGDDENIRKLGLFDSGVRVISYGAGDENEFVIKNFTEEGLGSRFEILRSNLSLGEFELSVPGYHNAKNALAVVSLLVELGVSVQDIKKTLPEFKGVKRRIERIGEMDNGVLIFDDYAHHPEEIRKSLEALHGAYPLRKIILVFQAHTFERTKALLKEFASSFVGVSELIILPTFASARDLNEHNASEDQDFIDKIRSIQPNVKLIETKARVVEYIKNNISGSDKIVVTMGAGDVYHVAEELV